MKINKLKFLIPILAITPATALVSCSFSNNYKNESWEHTGNLDGFKSLLKDKGIVFANDEPIKKIFEDVRNSDGFYYKTSLFDSDSAIKIFSILVRSDDKGEIIRTDSPEASDYKDIDSKMEIEHLPDSLKTLKINDVCKFSNNEYKQAKKIICIIDSKTTGENHSNYSYVVNKIVTIGEKNDSSNSNCHNNGILGHSNWNNNSIFGSTNNNSCGFFSNLINWDQDDDKNDDTVSAVSIKPLIFGSLDITEWK